MSCADENEPLSVPEMRTQENPVSISRKVILERDIWERAVRIVEQSAARVVRKEVAVVKKVNARCGIDRGLLRRELEHFYKVHVELVMESMQLSQIEAENWCGSQVAELEANSGDTDTWIHTKPADLSARAIGRWSWVPDYLASFETEPPKPARDT